MSDIRGRDPSGTPRDVAVDTAGHLDTRARLFGVTESGAQQQARVTDSGALRVGARTYDTGWARIPGIGAAAVYADEDAFGTAFQFEVPKSGVIQTALVVDEDDEDIDVALLLFRAAITSGTDNDPYAPALADLLRFEGFVNLGIRGGISGVTLGSNPGLALSYVAPQGRLWVQAVARGVLNIAADKGYYVALKVLADD